VGVAAAWGGFWTYTLLMIKKRFWDLKVSPEEEDLGLDQAEHGEHTAYHDLHASPMTTPLMNH
jgi:ammonia channel protein AmtB